MSDFQRYKTCPPHTTNRDASGLKWSGATPVPPIGAIVWISVNGIGLAEVVGYGSEDGWLGVFTVPLDPPPWWIKQNGPPTKANAALAYGAEISAP